MATLPKHQLAPFRALLAGLAVCLASLSWPAFAAADDAPKLWSLQPLTRPAVPPGLESTANPIDAFLAARARAKGVTPVEPADQRTLLRRVYLDLVGLPPTP